MRLAPRPSPGLQAERVEIRSHVLAGNDPAQPRGRALASDEMAQLFATCAGDATPKGRRDAAMFAVFYGCGVRRGELARLDADDFRPRSQSQPRSRMFDVALGPTPPGVQGGALDVRVRACPFRPGGILDPRSQGGLLG